MTSSPRTPDTAAAAKIETKTKPKNKYHSTSTIHSSPSYQQFPRAAAAAAPPPASTASTPLKTTTTATTSPIYHLNTREEQEEKKVTNASPPPTATAAKAAPITESLPPPHEQQQQHMNLLFADAHFVSRRMKHSPVHLPAAAAAPTTTATTEDTTAAAAAAAAGGTNTTSSNNTALALAAQAKWTASSPTQQPFNSPQRFLFGPTQHQQRQQLTPRKPQRQHAPRLPKPSPKRASSSSSSSKNAAAWPAADEKNGFDLMMDGNTASSAGQDGASAQRRQADYFPVPQPLHHLFQNGRQEGELHVRAAAIAAARGVGGGPCGPGIPMTGEEEHFLSFVNDDTGTNTTVLSAETAHESDFDDFWNKESGGTAPGSDGDLEAGGGEKGPAQKTAAAAAGMSGTHSERENARKRAARYTVVRKCLRTGTLLFAVGYCAHALYRVRVGGWRGLRAFLAPPKLPELHKILFL